MNKRTFPAVLLVALLIEGSIHAQSLADRNRIIGTWPEIMESAGIFTESSDTPGEYYFTQDRYEYRDEGALHGRHVAETGWYRYDPAAFLLEENVESVWDDDLGRLRPLRDHELIRFEHRSVFIRDDILCLSAMRGFSPTLSGAWERLGAERYFAVYGDAEYLRFDWPTFTQTFSGNTLTTHSVKHWLDETGEIVETEAYTSESKLVEITDEYFVAKNSTGMLWYPYTIAPDGESYVLTLDLTSYRRSEAGRR